MGLGALCHAQATCRCSDKAFYEYTLTQDVDPATGKPNPAATEHFFATHPEAQPFAEWAKTAPWTDSWADRTYNSLNAFRFVNADGQSQLVRWSMQHTEAEHFVDHATLATLGPDFLAQDLKQRLAQRPLSWRLVATLAQPGDPSNDATKVWPADREHVDIGTLIVRQAQDEADGPCRDYNYDPNILPVGIEVSDDPLLASRSIMATCALTSNTRGRSRMPKSGLSRSVRGAPSNGRPYRRLTRRPSYEGFGRRPVPGRSCAMWAGVRKRPKEETAGRKGAVWLGATYGDLKVADGGRALALERKAEIGGVRKDDHELVRPRRDEWLA